MKIKYRILIAWTSLVSRKYDWIRNMLLLFITIIMLLFFSTVSKTIGNEIDKYYLQSPGFRNLSISVVRDKKDILWEKLEKINNPHIIDFFLRAEGTRMEVVDSENIKKFKENKKSKAFGQIVVSASRMYDSNCKIDGEWIEKEQSHIGIIPKYFSLTCIDDTQAWNTKLEYIDGKELIGKTINLKYYTYKEDGYDLVRDGEHEYYFKVVGTYDNVMLETGGSDVLLPYDDLIKIDQIYETHDNEQEYTGVNYVVRVDKFENVEDVKEMLIKSFRDINAPVVAVQFPGTFARLTKVTEIISKLLIVFGSIVCFCIITIVYYRMIKRRTREIGMYKAIGYTNINIVYNLMLETILAGALTFVVAVTINQTLLIIINTVIKYNASIYLKELRFHTAFSDILLSIIVCFCVPIVGTLAGVVRSTKMEAKDIMYENN